MFSTGGRQWFETPQGYLLSAVMVGPQYSKPNIATLATELDATRIRKSVALN